MPGPQSSPDQLDKLAREQGFHDYATMQAYYARRSESLRQNTTTAVAGPQQSSAAPRPAQPDARSWYQRLFDAMGGH